MEIPNQVSQCIARAESAPEYVAEPDMAAVLVVDSLKQVVGQQLGHESDHTSPFFSLYGQLENALVVDGDTVSLAETITGQDDLAALAIALNVGKTTVDCSGCELATACRVDDIFTGSENAVNERIEKARISEKFFAAPQWMRGAWIRRFVAAPDKSISREDQAILSQARKDQVCSIGSADLATMIYIPKIELVGSAYTAPAGQVAALRDAKTVRPDTAVEIIDIRTSNAPVRIIDGRPAISANNAQNPNQNDVNDFLLNLLKRAGEVIDGKPGLQVSDPSYRSLAGYKGVGQPFEFWARTGEGGKSRLYGIVTPAEIGGEMGTEFTIIGASSGNGMDAQKQFFRAVGIPVKN